MGQIKEANSHIYKCVPCGYLYDPLEGDLDKLVFPGTSFHQVDNHWNCPVCGSSKKEFERLLNEEFALV